MFVPYLYTELTATFTLKEETVFREAPILSYPIHPIPAR